MYVLAETINKAPQEIVRPIPREAGAGRALPRGFVKTGVSSAGSIDTIPRTDAIGWLLFALMGAAAEPTAAGTLWAHEFTMAADEFELPYMTVRREVAGLWGESSSDNRVAGLTLTVPAVDIVRASWAFMGRLPQMVSAAAWSPATYLDDSNPFLSCVATLTSPDAGTFIASNIVITWANVIALNEEWYVGSYSPYDLTVGGRVCVIQCDIRGDATLYQKMGYDPTAGELPESWSPEILSDGAFALEVKTQADIPHTLKFEADAVNDNIDWAVQPVVVQAAANVQMMRVTGTLKASAGTQAKWTLTNAHTGTYGVYA